MTASNQNNLNNFVGAQSKMDTTFSPDTLVGVSLYMFNSDPNIVPGTKARIPLHIRTGQQSMGNPTERKRYRQVEVHGKGTCHIRVYVDGVFIHEGDITLSENPSKTRRLGIPIGTRGYTIDLELSGDANVRAVEYTAEEMSATS